MGTTGLVDVRDLDGEDLAAIGWADEDVRLRCLGEASAVALRVEHLDVLAACAGGYIVGIGAVGHGSGVASMASVSVDPEWASREVTPQLVRSLERRASSAWATLVRVHVEADDEAARALFEGLGYELVGAGTMSWSPADDSVRHVDSWVLHKTLAQD